MEIENQKVNDILNSFKKLKRPDGKVIRIFKDSPKIDFRHIEVFNEKFAEVLFKFF